MDIISGWSLIRSAHSTTYKFVINGEEEMEVEGILDSRWRNDGLEYLVKWKA
jgi:hypothetical protein